MKRIAPAILLALVASLLAVPISGHASDQLKTAREYLVLYADGASTKQARSAIGEAGGRIVRENTAIGLATVRTRNAHFFDDAMAQKAISGVASNRVVGRAPDTSARDPFAIERLAKERRASLGTGGRTASRTAAAPTAEPLADLQWDMQMINATADGSYAVQPGEESVRVGIIDTGIDGSHPDIAPNFDAGLSRNFTTDIPLVDGKCNQEPDHSCSDPANVDENGHGTHVAGTVAAPINGLGMAGVAPNVTLVNLRAGQDSGFFFLQETVDALTYAGDNGIDVVNMSFYTDPWLYNCGTASPSPQDSPEATQEQQTIIDATQQAVNYARSQGVTLIAAEGNGHTDLGNPTFDDTSPDFPPGSEYDRDVSNGCLDVPTESTGVMSISALGPSERKAYYSNYGVEQTTVSAPGGDFRDFIGTDAYRTPQNLVLAPYPESLAREAHEVNGHGRSKTPFVVADCADPKKEDTCAYYQYLQGTSMASPHAVGVAALIISQYGSVGANGFGMDPAAVQTILQDTARDHACPAQNPFVYPDRDASHTALCVGNAEFNGFYGHGIVDALSAVTPAE